MQNQAPHHDHPLAAAVAAEEQQYQYEIEGAPWWMPINEDIDYQPGAAPADISPIHNNIPDPKDRISIIDPVEDDVAYMDSVKVIVKDNPWLQHKAEQKLKDEQDDAIAQKKYLLSIEYQVNCRKFILFTSLLFFIVILTFASSVYTGFYKLKGWSFNSVVAALLFYGIIVGLICSNMNKYKTRTLLWLLNTYWFVAWTTIIGLFCTACVYLVLFPNKFIKHCDEHHCDATTEAIIFAECSLFCTLILYIFMMLFYMQRIGNLVIIISNLRDYRNSDESRLFNRICHKHMYRYIKGWKAFRRIISKYTGLRVSDVLYCSCWFRKCRRNSSQKWRPKPKNRTGIALSTDLNDLQRYSSLDDAGHGHDIGGGQKLNINESVDIYDEGPLQKAGMDSDEEEEKKQEEIQKEKPQKYQAVRAGSYDIYGNNHYVYAANYDRQECCLCCDNMSIRGNNNMDCWLCYFCCRDCCLFCDCRDICNGCGECVGDMCKGIGHCCSGINCDGCVCCLVYHTDNVGDCTQCCHACGHICGGCCEGCGNCNGCDCKGCDGDGEGVLGVCGAILVGIVCVILFLLPIIVFCLLAAPFWLLAQWTCWKLNDKAPWIIVVLIFILFMIPPCAIWGLMWTWICYGNMHGTFMTVMCQIWSFFYTVYSSLQ